MRRPNGKRGRPTAALDAAVCLHDASQRRGTRGWVDARAVPASTHDALRERCPPIGAPPAEIQVPAVTAGTQLSWRGGTPWGCGGRLGGAPAEPCRPVNTGLRCAVCLRDRVNRKGTARPRSRGRGARGRASTGSSGCCFHRRVRLSHAAPSGRECGRQGRAPAREAASSAGTGGAVLFFFRGCGLKGCGVVVGVVLGRASCRRSRRW